MKNTLSLFEAYGIEMEFMIVNKNSLKVLPICDQLFEKVTGTVTSDVVQGRITWSNELVNHVVELKVTQPEKELSTLHAIFHDNVQKINQELAELNGMLLPTAMHPLMDPLTETVLWPHDNKEIYQLYDKIFNCKGHGWSNLQSTHLNLPFSSDEEFGKLHAAIRVLLPIIPAISASSPIFEGKASGFLDTRLETYRKNQQRIPSITGKVIPEQIFTEADYNLLIFERIKFDIAPFDPDSILDHYFLNSRGAIARFDRKAIEIRIIDLQESPKADMALIQLVVACLKALVNGEFGSVDLQKSLHEDVLAGIFLETVKTGKNTTVVDKEYLQLWDIAGSTESVETIWNLVFEKAQKFIHPDSIENVKWLLKNGSLSERILNNLQEDFSPQNIHKVYNKISDCLKENIFFS